MFIHLLEVDEAFGIPFFILGIEPSLDGGGGSGLFVEISDSITVTSVAALELKIVIDNIFRQFGTVFLVGIDSDRRAEINDMVGGIIVLDDLPGILIEDFGPLQSAFI